MSCSPKRPSALPPRSILKSSRANSPASVSFAMPDSPRTSSVRFPSSPKLSTVHYTHCPISYDRSPIIVSQNICALPERNCRDYTTNTPPANWGKEAHPSIMSPNSPHCSLTDESTSSVPPLISDEGSSEESDGLASPPPELAITLPGRDVPSQSHLHSAPLSHPPIRNSKSGSPLAMSRSDDSESSEYSLSFLPHGSPMTPKRRHHLTPRASSTGFGSTWGATEEVSCLGGF